MPKTLPRKDGANGYGYLVIAHLKGIVARKTNSTIVIDVSGVGYLVHATNTLTAEAKVGQEITLQTVQTFREDLVQLFGFESVEEVEIFNLLGTVTGVGSKTALSIINSLGVQGIKSAVAGAEVEKFNSVSGIGPKTAKLIILSLTGKLVTENHSDNTPSVANVISALTNLGFQERKARSVTEELVKENADLTEQELLRQALSSLSAARRVSGND